MFLLLAGCAEVPPPAQTADTADSKTAQPQKASMAKVSVDQLSTLLAEDQAVPVDANDSATRAKLGLIPGAIALTSYEDFKSAELPADKSTKLVFYCYNEKCSAGEQAAKTARGDGYKDVHVLPAGIKGWTAAGKDVDRPANFKGKEGEGCDYKKDKRDEV